MKAKSLLVGLCVLGVGMGVGLQWPAKAAARLLPFQGRLTDAQGQVVADGERVVQFKLYNAPVGGQAVWNGEVQKLTVNSGLVSTLLGSKATLGGVDFNQDLYLELTLDANGDGQITLALEFGHFELDSNVSRAMNGVRGDAKSSGPVYNRG